MEIKYPILGIDVSKAKLDLCILDAGVDLDQLTVPNTPKGFAALHKHLAAHRIAIHTACLEATSVYSAAIALDLHEHGITVVVANPAAVHAFMHAELRRAKTDKADAVSIAKFARAMADDLHPWQPLPACYEELRELTRRLYAIRCSMARTKNQMEHQEYFRSAARPVIVHSLEADLAHYRKQANKIRKELKRCLQANEELQRRYDLLTTAKGVAEVTALTFMAEVPDIHQFSEAKELAAFAGITPHIKHSGTKEPVSAPISKMGSARLRQAMYMASLSAKRYNPPLARFARRLHSRGKKPMVVNIAVARKLLHQLYAIDCHQIPFDPNYSKNYTEPGTT